jgi:hypothetical protein
VPEAFSLGFLAELPGKPIASHRPIDQRKRIAKLLDSLEMGGIAGH